MVCKCNIAITLLLSLKLAQAGVILYEDFEDGLLDPRISIQQVGGFNSAPGIKTTASLGGSKAFGFGLSNCRFNCFFEHTSSLLITFQTPTFVSEISFREMELFGNWGSDGSVFFDGVPYGNGFRDFGRLPYNDGSPDTAFRMQIFPVNRTVSRITIMAADITDSSEIFIDDLQVSDGTPGTPTPEPSGLGFCSVIVVILGSLIARRRAVQARRVAC